MKKAMFYKSNKRNFKATKFIVTINGKPGFFDGDQICFSAHRLTAKAPTELYTKEEAKQIIKRTIRYRSEQLNHQNEEDRYGMMPVYF